MLKKHLTPWLLSGAVALAAVGYAGVYTYSELGQYTRAQTVDGFGQVFFFPDPDARQMSLQLIYPKGEMANPYAQGIPHYVEHLVADQMWPEKNSTDLRHSNAWTNSFATGYWGEVAPKDLQSGLQTLANTAAPLEVDAQFAQEEIGIVLSEYRTRGAHTEIAQMWQGVTDQLYEAGPAARSVIGTPEEIEAYTLDIAKTWHGQSHHLADASLLIYGPLSARQMAQALDAVDLPEGPAGAWEGMNFLSDFTPDRLERGVWLNGDDHPDVIYRKLVRISDCADTLACEARLNLLENLLDSATKGGLAGPLRYDAFIARSFDFDLVLQGIVDGEGIVEIRFDAAADKDVSQSALLSAFEAALQTALTSPIPDQSFDRIKARRLDGWDVSDYDALKEYRHAIGRLQTGLAPVREKARYAADEAVDLPEIEALARQLAGDGRVVIRKVH